MHALSEGAAAAGLAADDASARRLRADYLWSRLLRFVRLPGYNAVRCVRFRDGLQVNYRFNRGDMQSLREVLVDEVYDCDLPFAPHTFLDLGANIGLASLWFSNRIRPDPTQSNRSAFLLAVEPVPENAAVAEMNFQDNHISGEVVRAAVGQHAGEAWFEARAESNLGRLVNEGSTQAGMRVPVVGIRDLLGRFPECRVDLVKMDIEGGEEELLSRDTGWLAQVKALIVEWHDDRADSRPLIRNVESAGFQHQLINTKCQDNLSLFLRKDA